MAAREYVAWCQARQVEPYTRTADPHSRSRALRALSNPPVQAVLLLVDRWNADYRCLAYGRLFWLIRTECQLCIADTVEIRDRKADHNGGSVRAIRIELRHPV